MKKIKNNYKAILAFVLFLLIIIIAFVGVMKIKISRKSNIKSMSIFSKKLNNDENLAGKY